MKGVEIRKGRSNSLSVIFDLVDVESTSEGENDSPGQMPM